MTRGGSIALNCRICERNKLEILPGLRLDPATLLFAASALGFLLAGVSFSFDDARRGRHFGLAQWGVAMFMGGGGFLLSFLHGYAPPFLTFVVANTLFLAVAPFGLLAHGRLFGAAIPLVFVTLVSAFGLSGVMGVYFMDAPRYVSIFTVSSALAVQLGMIAVVIFRNTASRASAATWISCATMVLMAATYAIRAVISISGDATTVLPSAKSVPQVSALILGAMFAVSSSFGMFSMVSERRYRESMATMRRDGLTGLLTRAAFFETAGEIEKLEGPAAYAIVMIDIDHFKVVNDTYGHSAGDTTLEHAGRLIVNSVRISDVAGRFGGEEFCILMRGCGENQAAQLATRLVVEARQQNVRLSDGQDVRFTLSAGYAWRSAKPGLAGIPETIDDVIERADQALYRAKRGGRNQAFGAQSSNFTGIAVI